MLTQQCMEELPSEYGGVASGMAQTGLPSDVEENTFPVNDDTSKIEGEKSAD